MDRRNFLKGATVGTFGAVVGVVVPRSTVPVETIARVEKEVQAPSLEPKSRSTDPRANPTTPIRDASKDAPQPELLAFRWRKSQVAPGKTLVWEETSIANPQGEGIPTNMYLHTEDADGSTWQHIVSPDSMMEVLKSARLYRGN